MNHIQVIARAFIHDQNSILLAFNGDNFFLPGGHVKYNEPVLEALTRELGEEIALKNLVVGNFIGVVENSYNYKGNNIHEHCFIFHVSSNALSSSKPVISQESHISFHWKPIANLQNENFRPEGMNKFLNDYIQSNKPKFQSFFNNS